MQIENFLIAAAITLAVLSPMTGSFLKCWADRARIGKSVADGRSYCDNCGKTLEARDLVPILSWLWQGGKSRCCDTPISPLLLLAEVAALAMAISALFVFPQGLWLPALIIAWCIQAIALLAGSGTDYPWRIAAAATVVAIGISILGGSISIDPVLSATGALAGLAIWMAARRLAPRFRDAILLAPVAGALLGPLNLVAVGIATALLFTILRTFSPERDSDVPRLAKLIATMTWLAWLWMSS